MIEPPSPELLQRLTDLGLARPRDLRRCRSRVRQLVRDLPAFDSVWIDALVQIEKLTPFQARVLESSKPDELKVGPCVLVRQLGNKGQTFFARHRDTGDSCVLKFIDLPGQSGTGTGFAHTRRINSLVIRHESPDQIAELLKTKFSSSSHIQHPSIVMPHSCIQHGGQLIAISRFEDGMSLRELLMRRGRFPADVVMSLLRQLIDAMLVLEQAEMQHGEIRTSKIRLNSSGRAILVDAGIRQTLRPVLSVPIGLDVDECEGIAPELIGSRREPDSRSDLFALGCTMWTLLAGRSPFPTGDPLAKLASLRTRPVPDVREWAPETSKELADCLTQMTAFDREQRPESFAAVAGSIGRAGRSDRNRVASFRASFHREAAIPTSASWERPRTSRTPITVAAVLAILLAIGVASDWPSSEQLLSIRSRVERVFDENANQRPSEVDQETIPQTSQTEPIAVSPPGNIEVHEFPTANSKGVIELVPGQVYLGSSIAAAGDLKIVANGDQPAVIEVSQPMVISADELHIGNVEFRRKSADCKSLLSVKSQALIVNQCRFVGLISSPESEPINHDATLDCQGISWAIADPAGAANSRLLVVSSDFAGLNIAIDCHDAPAKLQLADTLALRTSALIHVPLGGAVSAIHLRQVTCRNVAALISATLRGTEQDVRPIQLQIERSVLALDPKIGSLVRFTGQLPKDGNAAIQVQAKDSYQTPSVTAATWQAADSTVPSDLINSSLVSIEGMSLAEIEFDGPAVLPRANSACDAPKDAGVSLR